jgi:hypothetical protein
LKKVIIFFLLSITIFTRTIEEYHLIIDSYLTKNKIKNKDNIRELIIKYSKQFDVNPLLVTAMIKQESGFNQKVISSAGAIGILQLMPFTAKDLGVNPYDLEENLYGGIKYIAYLLEKNDRDIPNSLASYNAGLGAVQKYNGIPPYKETKQYVKNIVSIFNNLNYVKESKTNDINLNLINNEANKLKPKENLENIQTDKEINMNLLVSNESTNENFTFNQNSIRYYKMD